MRILKGHTNHVFSVAVLSDGKVVSGSEDNTFRVWDLSTGESVLTNYRLLDTVVCPFPIYSALKSVGLSHVSACCELTKSSGLGGAGLAVGMDSGKMYFFTLLVSMHEFVSTHHDDEESEISRISHRRKQIFAESCRLFKLRRRASMRGFR